MPIRLPAAPPSVASEKFPPNRVVTVAPGAAVDTSSFTAASVALPLATGASFTAVTLIVTVSVSLSVPAPLSVVLSDRVA